MCVLQKLNLCVIGSQSPDKARGVPSSSFNQIIIIGFLNSRGAAKLKEITRLSPVKGLLGFQNI